MANNNYILVYHGSDCIVKKPDLNKCKRGKDFGKGFYITTDKYQAINFAKIIAHRNGKKKGYLNIYKLSPFINIKKLIFAETNIDWLNCIVGNRDYRFNYLKKKWESYEVIIGKIADDDTAQVINAYLSGAYGKIGSIEAVKIAVKMFKPKNLKNQICLKSIKSLSFIEFIDYIEVDL